MNSFVIIIILLAFFGCKTEDQHKKPRLLVTTDIGGDPDDQQSMVRLLTFSNEFEIEGLIASASGTPGELGVAVVKPHLIEELIDAYAEVENNLRLNDIDFPTASYLKTCIKSGNPQRGWDAVGEGKDTEGSEWIIKCVDEEEERPLNIAIWGGQTDLAQALWKVKNTRTPDEYAAFVSKIRVHDIADQDGIFMAMWEAFPGLFYVLNKAPQGEDKRNAVFRGMYLGGPEELTALNWLKQHVLDNHGPLGALYPTKTWTAPNPYGNMKEGDTPSWFYFLLNGLHAPDYPEYGGWGGRFQKSPEGYYTDATDWNDTTARATVWRWREEFQNHFAARMDWCVQKPRETNHAPEIFFEGQSHNLPVDIYVESNQKLSFDLGQTSDPDGDEFNWEWMLYDEITTMDPRQIAITIAESTLTIAIRNPRPGSTAHLILKAIDNGTPELTTYQRLVIHVRE